MKTIGVGIVTDRKGYGPAGIRHPPYVEFDPASGGSPQTPEELASVDGVEVRHF